MKNELLTLNYEGDLKIGKCLSNDTFEVVETLEITQQLIKEFKKYYMKATQDEECVNYMIVRDYLENSYSEELETLMYFIEDIENCENYNEFYCLLEFERDKILLNETKEIKKVEFLKCKIKEKYADRAHYRVYY